MKSSRVVTPEFVSVLFEVEICPFFDIKIFSKLPREYKLLFRIFLEVDRLIFSE